MSGYPYLFALILLLVSSGAGAQESPILQLDPGGHMAMINDLAFTADGRHLVSAGDDKVVRIWDIARGETVRTIRGEIGPGRAGQIYAMALSSDDKWLAVGGFMANYDREAPNPQQVSAVRLFDFTTGALVATLEGHTNIIVSLAFSPDGKTLVSGSLDQDVRVWDVERRRLLHTLSGHEEAVYALTFSADGERIVSGSSDGELRFWRRDGTPAARHRNAHQGEIHALAASAQGLVASGGGDRAIQLWDAATGERRRLLSRQENSPGSLAFTPDGKFLLAGVSSGANMHCPVYRVADGKRVADYTGHDNAVMAVAVSPSGRTAATGGGSQQQIHLWSLLDGRQEQILSGVGGSVWAVGLGQDESGRRLLAWGKTQNPDGEAPLEYEMRLPGAGDVLGVPQSRGDRHSFNRSLHAVGDWRLEVKANPDGVPSLLEVRQGRRSVAVIERGSDDGFQHRAFSFTPDGETVISAGANGALSAYSREGIKLGDFIGHTGDIWSIAVSSDGRLLASASADQTVRLWDIDHQRPLLSLFHGAARTQRALQRVRAESPQAHGDIGEWIAWTPSGYYAASADGSRYIGWHQNRGLNRVADYYPVSQFAATRYVPDLVSDTVEFHSETEALTRRQQRDRRKTPEQSTAMLIAQVPDTPRILSAPPPRVQDPVHQITIEVDDRTEQLTLNVNGLGGTRGFQRADVRPREGKVIKRTVELQPGENRIEIVARNAAGDSTPQILSLRYEAEYRKPNLFVLAIGVSHYADPGLNLNFAAIDAKALARRFEQEQGAPEKLYKQIHTKILTDAEVTRSSVIDAMDFLARMTEDDLAILFVAGHGMQDERGNFYYLPHDVDIERLRTTGVAWEDFREAIDYLPGKVMLLADTCHSGGIYGDRGRRAAVDMSRLAYEFADAGRGVIVFASSQGKEFSEERPDWGHGAFTRSLLDGLSGEADYTGDGVIKQTELETYVKDRVSALTEGRQHPVTQRPNVIADFAVAVAASSP